MSEAKFNLGSWVLNSSSLKCQENTADSTVPTNVFSIRWHTDTDTDKLSLIPKTATLDATNLITKHENL